MQHGIPNNKIKNKSKKFNDYLRKTISGINMNLFDVGKWKRSSLFTPRAIFYRYEKNMNDLKVSVAVVVQEMVESEISGITFTVHPVTKAANQMIIEAGYGLGEAVVSGKITPDSYIVDKDDFSILDINIAEQKKMLVKKGAAGGLTWKNLPVNKQE
ncbi:MAG: hypothetical protein IIC12_00810, partial [Proteobacteria bacterium]|nr:hypothetical protein [Pseudomonadota bacterium]